MLGKTEKYPSYVERGKTDPLQNAAEKTDWSSENTATGGTSLTFKAHKLEKPPSGRRRKL